MAFFHYLLHHLHSILLLHEIQITRLYFQPLFIIIIILLLFIILLFIILLFILLFLIKSTDFGDECEHECCVLDV